MHIRLRWMLGLWCVSIGLLSADVRLPGIFSDHMVLQQGIDLPVWGQADPGEKVTVTVGTASASTVADGKGRWNVHLPSQPVSKTPVTVTVAGKNTRTFSDVLIGDVWLCAGGVNMNDGIGLNPLYEPAITKGDWPLIRMFVMPRRSVPLAVDSMEPYLLSTELPELGRWQVCSPAILRRDGTVKGFSAIGFFFGRDLLQATGRPVGLIQVTYPGALVGSWLSVEGLQKNPALAGLARKQEQALADYRKNHGENYPVKKIEYDLVLEQWNELVKPDYDAAMDKWKKYSAEEKGMGLPVPPPPQLAQPKPEPPPDLSGGPESPANVFNGMIAPLAPYGLRGIIWYSVAKDADTPGLFKEALPELIADWRAAWGQGDVPFLYVLKPGGDKDWLAFAEAQIKGLAIPHTGMANAIDVDGAVGIHPWNKKDIGLRLSLAAQRLVYGREGTSPGPIFDRMTVEGGKIRVNFRETGTGLVIAAPSTDDEKAKFATEQLIGFFIAGQDRKWHPAQAVIDGNSVVVSSPDVAAPLAVRYAWTGLPLGNLYNKDYLPALPFRTDDWPLEVPPPPVTPDPKPEPPTVLESGSTTP